MTTNKQQAARDSLDASGIPFSEQVFLNHVQSGDHTIVEKFLIAGIRPDAMNADGKSALLIATRAGHQDIVRLLISKGASTEQLSSELTQKARKKDFWEKLAAIGPIATSISVALFGGLYSFLYQTHQSEAQKADTARNNKLLELQAMEKMIPHLADPEQSKGALIAIKTFATDPKLVQDLALLYPNKGSIMVLEQWCASEDKNERIRALSALTQIAGGPEPFSEPALRALRTALTIQTPSVVKIELVKKNRSYGSQSGVIVAENGVVATVDYDLGEDISIFIVTPSGARYPAKNLASENGILLLLAETKDKFQPIEVSPIIAKKGERVVAAGFSQGTTLDPTTGTVLSNDSSRITILLDKVEPVGANGRWAAGVGGGP